MLSAEDKQEIREMFGMLIDELKRNHLIKKPNDSIYQDVSQRLYGFYKYGETDTKMLKVLSELQEDLYFNIIPLFYKNKYTIDNIADMMNCDTSTIVRNKKRMCTAIYIMLQQEK